MDDMNDLSYERPGKVDVVTGQAGKEEYNEGVWVKVSRRTYDPHLAQEEETKERTRRMLELYPFFGKTYSDRKFDEEENVRVIERMKNWEREENSVSGRRREGDRTG